MKKHTKRLLKIINTSLCLGLFFMLFITPIYGDQKVVRVAFPEQESFTMKDDKGEYSGYTYDYLKEVAKYTGWHLEIIEVEGDINQQLSKCMEMLSNGEIDIMGGFAKNDATLAMYDFADESYGTLYNTIVVPIENATVSEYTLTTTKGIKVALNKNAKIKNEQFFDYAKRNAIDYEIVWCENTNQTIETVKNGLADIYTSVTTSIDSSCRSIAKYSPTPFYLATTKGNVGIVQDINLAIENINQTNPMLINKLYKKYFDADLTKLVLTNKEKEYITQNNKLKVLVQDNHAPIEHYNKENNIDGIAYRVLEKVEEYTGFEMEYVYTKNYQEYVQKIKNKEVDLVLCVEYDYDIAEELSIALTNPFLEDNTVLILKSGLNMLDLENKVVATTYKEASSIEKKVKKDKIRYFDTLEQCLEAVDTGTCDYTYGSNYAVSYYDTKNTYKNIMLISQNQESKLRYSFGMIDNNDIYLTTILNKSVQLINTYELENIIYQSSQQVKEFSILQYIQDNLFISVLIAIGIVATGIGLLLLYYQNQLRMKKQTELEYKRYLSLTEITNEIIFEYDYNKDYLSFTNTDNMLEGQESIFENYSQNVEQLSNPIMINFHNLLLEKKDIDTEICIQSKEGNDCWYRIIIKVIYDDQKAMYAIGKATDIHEQKLEKERLVKENRMDSLCNVYNGATCKKMIAEKLNTPGNHALCMIDLDCFKNVNDTFGHYVGDLVLIETAKLLKDTFNNDSIIGRIGGDEFLVFISNIVSKERVEEKCRSLIREVVTRKKELKDIEMTTVSIGIALTSATTDFTEVYKKADKALYQTKENGRNGYSTIE